MQSQNANNRRMAEFGATPQNEAACVRDMLGLDVSATTHRDSAETAASSHTAPVSALAYGERKFGILTKPCATARPEK